MARKNLIAEILVIALVVVCVGFTAASHSFRSVGFVLPIGWGNKHPAFDEGICDSSLKTQGFPFAEERNNQIGCSVTQSADSETAESNKLAFAINNAVYGISILAAGIVVVFGVAKLIEKVES